MAALVELPAEFKEQSGTPAHGGSRRGAGRHPKALRYAHEVASQEARIVAALPELVDLLLSAARAGDTSAARYLVDRVLGRVQTQRKPIAEDYGLPADHPAAKEVAEMRRRRATAKEMAISPQFGDRVLVVGEERLVADAEVYAELGSTREEMDRLSEACKISRHGLPRQEVPRPGSSDSE